MLNKQPANSFKQIKPISKKDENCNSVCVCCMVNSCGDKTLMAMWMVEGGSQRQRQELPEETRLERGEQLNGENRWFCTSVLESQTENIPPKINGRCDQLESVKFTFDLLSV